MNRAAFLEKVDAVEFGVKPSEAETFAQQKAEVDALDPAGSTGNRYEQLVQQTAMRCGKLMQAKMAAGGTLSRDMFIYSISELGADHLYVDIRSFLVTFWIHGDELGTYKP